jgi:tetratricopeptide (TPR) repeat protein
MGNWNFNYSIDLLYVTLPLLVLYGNLNFNDRTDNLKNWLCKFVPIVLLSIPLVFGSRALLVGNALAITYQFALRYRPERFRYLVVIPLLSIIISLVSKVSSSLGRFHIWRIDILLLKDNWLKGLGSVPFNVAFNHKQIDWFRGQPSLYTKAAMVANDGYFAFNDWLQLAIEYGLIGIITSLTILVALVLIYWHSFVANSLNQILLQALTMMIPIVTLSMVSYPLQMPVIRFLFLFLICIVLYIKALEGSVFVSLSMCIKLVVIVGLSVSGLYSMLVFSRNWRNDNLFRQAKIHWEIGERAEAFQSLESLPVTTLYSSHPHAINIAYWYWSVGTIDKAINILEKHHEYHCNQRNHLLLGKWYSEIGDFENAESNLFCSLYITPHSLESRYALMNFYARYDKKEEAHKWAQELCNYPIKIKNPEALILIMKGKLFLDQASESH